MKDLKEGQPPVPVEYSMRKTPEGWKIYDIAVEGVSLVMTYRAEFENVFSKGGVRTDMEAPTGIVKYDLETGSRTFHDFGPTALSGEPVFVPSRPDAAEDEGYLVTYVFDADRSTSSFVVLDAADMGVDPIATVELPQRVPNGFHGSWFAAG